MTELKYTTHGETHTKLYIAWQNMKSRCTTNQNNNNYKYYRGKGIIVIQEWVNSYIKFRDWAFVNGYKEGLELDRRNNDGNYEPNNCRWVTRKVNLNNKSNNYNLTINNETHTASEWGEMYGLTYSTIKRRIKMGKTGNQLISPLKRKSKKIYEAKVNLI